MIRRLVLLVALTPLVALAQSATTYVVQPGDTLYRISEADETLCKRSLQNVAASIGDHVTDTI